MASPTPISCDVLVAGSGAGGLSAAITARLHGLDVIVAEKASTYGGTTARSGGWIWIPLSPHAVRAGVDDTAADALRYIEEEAGPNFDRAMAEAFVSAGPEMLALFEDRTDVRFSLSTTFPDYHPQRPGARSGGRSLDPEPFDARQLGQNLAGLSPPLRELSLAGMVIGSGTELKHFFNATRSLKSAAFVAKKMATHAMHLLRHGRGIRLVNGNALAARLAKTVFDLGVPLWLRTEVTELVLANGRVEGALVQRDGVPTRITVRKGVVLACGGFPHDVERRSRLYPHDAGAGSHFPLAPPTNTGDGVRLALAAGGRAADHYKDHAAWAPVSRLTWPDGSTGIYPHFVDRGKPGIIAVNAAGKRFVNESDSYHDFIRGYLDQGAGRMFFIADAAAVSRYGLGIVKPFPFPKSHWLRSGYLRRGDTIASLAQATGIDPMGLQQTIDSFNRHAALGTDPEFQRGTTSYNHFQGDANNRPNPCLAPVQRPPFYAVEIRPGDIGTFAGLVTNEHAQVMTASGPIEGLHAVGNDMASVMGGAYPGGGITLGPALTFGFIAGRHLASH